MDTSRFVSRHSGPPVTAALLPPIADQLASVRALSSPIEQLLALARRDAHTTSISDIYIAVDEEPWAGIDGRVVRWPTLESFTLDRITSDDVNRFLNRHFSEALLKEFYTRTYATTSLHDDLLGTVRIHAAHTTSGINIVMRLLPTVIPDFDTLGLPEVIKSFINFTNGLLLFSGSVGSGKTTAVAALLNLINQTKPYAIYTIEDPIEYVHRSESSRVKQRAIGTDVPSYAEALRSLLREAPNIIFIGEMRDPETMLLAIMAAETGHLVISTVHDNGASASVQRIAGTFENSQEICTRLSQVLRAITSLRLVPRAGGRGRVALAEVLVSNAAIRQRIFKGEYGNIYQEISSGGSEGMQTLETDLKRKAAEGLIDPSALYQYANRPEYLS